MIGNLKDRVQPVDALPAERPAPTAMLHHVDSPDFADSETALFEACPEAAALIQALRGCQHPRSGRLMARLRDCQDETRMSELRAEIFQLLALSFGRAEAERRLQPLQ